MSAAHATIDLDDVEGLLAADREGLLHAASMAGAQMRATAAALAEGVLEPLRGDQAPRTVVWVATRGAAESAGAMLAAALGGSTAAPLVVASEVPPWIGALDVLVVAGDDAADPVLVAAAASGIRRGARVVVVAPDEGPLREAAAGRAVLLAPRLMVPDEFALTRYLAAGLAALHVVLPGRSVDLGALADELDAEALRNSAGRELFTNPAKSLAERLSGRDVVLAGGNAASVALARHVGAILLRVAQQPVSAVGLADVLTALRRGLSSGAGDYESSIFHDEELDGPLPARVRTLVFATDEERPGIVATLDGYDDVDVLSADDVPDVVTPRPSGRPEEQLAMLAVRLEMAAAYLRLVRG
ncbi:TobH protein [Mycolicibacterium madagascariense]|uniref:TobH protein n=1 Tax=Mycolicibacterium madagascariense TaxID=212765 RepID=A0A7I7XDV0_9MYCO|nr:TobH protein [Mycolicibacterium madagascariense]MCV7015775.1 TobH protein [Mycolicibacterium madagascariense]BBZ27193.1 TobH protein [Mycolicibacterium madagascariense]